jgi:hypothetical protein
VEEAAGAGAEVVEAAGAEEVAAREPVEVEGKAKAGESAPGASRACRARSTASRLGAASR